MPDVYVDVFEFPDGTQVHFKDDRVDNLPKPMVYKGTLGTGGTITTLPVDGSATVGDTYKVITAGTYAEVDADIGDMFVCQTKTSSTNTWDHVPSGDDQGGGHEIADDTGTILPQEPVMQFVGTYSEDDNTNNKTKVNVVRSMTKNQFDQLSEAEKKGFINVTDDVSCGLKYVKEVLWENLDESNMTILSNGSTISLSDNIFNYDEIYFEGCFYETNNTTGKKLTHFAVTKVMRDTIALAKSKYGTGQYEGMFDVAHNIISAGSYYSFMYCLKVPTDNSIYVAFKHVGSWDASKCTLTRVIGVKYLSESEHTYSTNEQIVGTWIDGSTVYEKTFNVNNVLCSTSGWTNLVAFSGVDKIISYDSVFELSNGQQLSFGFYVMFNYESGYVKYYCREISSYTMTVRLTLRYTKSSS